MDKEAVEMIAGAITNNLLLRVPQPIIRADVWIMAEEIMKRLELSGYRKLKDNPPLIHADGCSTNLGIIGAMCNCGAQTQRDSDIKWYGGKDD